MFFFINISASTIYDCNFECNCTCSWTNDPTGKYPWQVVRGSTESSGTGPDGDHTTGSMYGHFAHIESSYPAQFNDASRLISPNLIVTNDEQCFRFYYHMFGADVYQLNIYALISN